jgi:putative membrane protein
MLAETGLLVLVLRWFISALALLLTAYIVPGFKVKNFTGALVASAIIGLANMTIWWLLFILTLPATILTFGLFVFVINAVVLRLCAAILRDFDITNWFSAIVGAVILSFVGTLLHYLIV